MASNGHFSVKLVYNFIETSKSVSAHLPGPSSTISMENLWKKLLRIELPRKIKLFAWKAYHNGLPMGSELHKRLGLDDVQCKFCGYKNESSIHLFKNCWWIRTVW